MLVFASDSLRMSMSLFQLYKRLMNLKSMEVSFADSVHADSDHTAQNIQFSLGSILSDILRDIMAKRISVFIAFQLIFMMLDVTVRD